VSTNAFLYALLLAAAFALGVLAALACMFREPSPSFRPLWLVPLGAALGFAATFLYFLFLGGHDV
jgi:peptidoglycan/LPS O-acetylase OafA/YrhL